MNAHSYQDYSAQHAWRKDYQPTQIISYSLQLHSFKQSFEFTVYQTRKHFSSGTCPLNRNTHPAATAGGMTSMSLSCASCRASER